MARLQGLEQVLGKVGLHLNLAKCNLWGPGVQDAHEAGPHYPEGCTGDHPGLQVPVIPFGGDRGITALGVPIDAPFELPQGPKSTPECHAVWGRTVDKADMLLQRLRSLPDGQVRHALLRYCLDGCRVVHLLRATETEGAGDHLAITQARLLEAVEDLLGMGVSDATWEQVSLPTRLGGLGISDPIVLQPAARMAALLNLGMHGRRGSSLRAANPSTRPARRVAPAATATWP